MNIKKLTAREILDSRGNPTLEVTAYTKMGISVAKVPSGASTGKHEAIELRDNLKKYNGKGVTKAAKNVETKISKKLARKDCRKQDIIDQLMLDLDKSKNKSKLGANAILGASMACARAGALESKKELYTYLNKYTKEKMSMPIPFCNVINGGKHAGNELALQEFMIVPIRSKSFKDATRAVSETYHVLKKLLAKKFGKNATNVGDEGGFAPPLKNSSQALNLLVKAIDEAGYSNEIKLAIDAAASEFYDEKSKYFIPRPLTNMQLVDYYVELIKTFPIISLEDPFDQDDFKPWKELMKKIKIPIVGDDLTVTNVNRIQMAQDEGLCNALLLKPNQIGSVTESLAAAKLAKSFKWNVMVSHRSGETDDAFISDLAVALGCGQAKIGAPCRGERVAKYNRFMEIEEQLGKKVKYAKW